MFLNISLIIILNFGYVCFFNDNMSMAVLKSIFIYECCSVLFLYYLFLACVYISFWIYWYLLMLTFNRLINSMSYSGPWNDFFITIFSNSWSTKFNQMPLFIPHFLLLDNYFCMIQVLNDISLLFSYLACLRISSDIYCILFYLDYLTLFIFCDVIIYYFFSISVQRFFFCVFMDKTILILVNLFFFCNYPTMC